MRRREFISLVGGATAWPIAARGQQGERMRRIGVHTGTRADDPDGKARFAAFEQALGQLGWTPGRNVRIDYRFSGGDAATSRKQADELVALAPDVIVTSGSFSTGILLQATRTVPTRRPRSTAAARRKTRRPRSSTSSIARSMRFSAMPR